MVIDGDDNNQRLKNSRLSYVRGITIFPETSKIRPSQGAQGLPLANLQLRELEQPSGRVWGRNMI